MAEGRVWPGVPLREPDRGTEEGDDRDAGHRAGAIRGDPPGLAQEAQRLRCTSP